MKFYANINNQEMILNFDDSKNEWSNSNGEIFTTHEDVNCIPVDESGKSIQGYFIIEVTDPNNVKSQFKLHTRDKVVSCFCGEYPGVVCDTQTAVNELNPAIKVPAYGLGDLVDTIEYGFNEGPFTDDDLLLEVDTDEDYTGPYKEDCYKWKVM